MLTSIGVKFISDSACLSATLGDNRLFRSASILQIADVVRRVVFLLFLPCFQPIVRLFRPRETSEIFRHFVVTTKTTQPRLPVLSVNGSIIWQFCCTLYGRHFSHIAKFFQIWSTVGSYDELCEGFSQSETEKYFERIIMIMILIV